MALKETARLRRLGENLRRQITPEYSKEEKNEINKKDSLRGDELYRVVWWVYFD